MTIDYAELVTKIERLADGHQNAAIADTFRGLAQRVRAIGVSPEIPTEVRTALIREIALEWMQLAGLEPTLPATLIEEGVEQQ